MFPAKIPHFSVGSHGYRSQHPCDRFQRYACTRRIDAGSSH